MKVKMDVTNADLKVGNIKINSISASSIVILGDAESFAPVNVSVTRGTAFPTPIPATATGLAGGGAVTGGPTGATSGIPGSIR